MRVHLSLGVCSGECLCLVHRMMDNSELEIKAEITVHQSHARLLIRTTDECVDLIKHDAWDLYLMTPPNLQRRQGSVYYLLINM